MLNLKSQIIIVLVAISIIGIFFGLWRTTSIKLDQARNEITEMTCTIDTLTKENARLVQYNKQRDAQIKELEKQYSQQLNSIPADSCGDTKPSKELIEFFKNEKK